LQEVSGNPDLTIPYWDWTVDDTPAGCPWQDDFMGGNGDPNDHNIVKTGPFREGEWRLVIFDFDDAATESQFPSLGGNIPWLTRGFGTDPIGRSLPTAQEVQQALSMPTYDVAPWDEDSDWKISFRNYLEGWRPGTNPPQHAMHNAVHLWVGGSTDGVGGSMESDSSPNDPVFFLHHANIDRIWVEWERRYGQVYLPVSGARKGQNLYDAMWPYNPPVRPIDMLNHRALGYIYDTEQNAVGMPRTGSVSAIWVFLLGLGVLCLSLGTLIWARRRAVE
jgi:tyrosinase